MKVVILAGGFGTRLEEETTVIPKPLVCIGDYPILWHLMKLYSWYGFNDFVICLGYKGYLIKEYFANYFLHQSNVTFDFTKEQSSMTFLNKNVESWKVTLIDTGHNVQTGGRLLRARPFIGKEPFLMTYGDAVSDINIPELIKFHQKNKRLATVTAVQPPGKFGSMRFQRGGKVNTFMEKPSGDGGWISGGFFVLDPGIFTYLKGGDECVWERYPLETLARKDQLMAYTHCGFWKCMDTLRDKKDLSALWADGSAQWKVWDKKN
jgi:glucose-1-phosphate cytidylyltransferase